MSFLSMGNGQHQSQRNISIQLIPQQERRYRRLLSQETVMWTQRYGCKKALPAWQKLTGLERGKYIFRIARLLQERAREFAVLETMDGGKPIKESRDVDIPLAAQHFFYYAGWADKLNLAFPERRFLLLEFVDKLFHGTSLDGGMETRSCTCNR